ncbi:MAG: sugar transferase, partial [Janibacter sp.]
ARVAMDLGVDVVACSGSQRLGPLGLRRLSWALEGSEINLVVAPGLSEVAGPRVVSRPVAGLPLLHVEAPSFSGPKLVLKSVIDWVGALILLLLFSPVLLVVAVCIKMHDRGPVFFRQQRVGLDGELFEMVKFRSMVINAEDRLAELRAQQARDDGRAAEGGTPVLDRGGAVQDGGGSAGDADRALHPALLDR